jgi:hypothetical protein
LDGKRHPRDMGETEVVAFLSALATVGHVSASTQNQARKPDLFVVTQIDAGGLKVFYPRNQGGYTMRADGKEYADTRTNALPDLTTSTEALGPRTLRRKTFRARSPLSQVDMTVSSDGKTLTVTRRTSGSEREPAVFVYEKQD